MTRAEEFAFGNYPPRYIRELDESASPDIDMNEDARMAYIEGFEQAEEDIIELIENKIKAIKKAHERGYWLDVISELEDIIEQID